MKTYWRKAFVVLAMSAGMASAQVLWPTNVTVVAGNTASFLVSGLNTSTALPPTRIYMFSEDPSRLSVPSEPIVQPRLFDAATTSYYYQSFVSGIEGLTAHALQQIDGLFSPIRVHFVGVMYGIIWSSSADVTVAHPTLSFHPDPAALRAGETIPLVVRRSIAANGSLNFTLHSEAPALLGLGESPEAPCTNSSLALRFGVFEITRTVWVRAFGSGGPLTNAPVVARVGSYAAKVDVWISTNAGLTLAPIQPAVVAGDALNMTVTRGEAQPVSPLTVYLLSSDPSVVAVPEMVVIPAGASSASFAARGLKPGWATISASAAGVPYTADSERQISVLNPTLSWSPDPLELAEGAVTLVRIRRPVFEAGAALNVALRSSDPSVLIVLASNVVMSAGHAEASFYVAGLRSGNTLVYADVGAYRTTLTATVTTTAAQADPDGDGLPTEWELRLGSDPYNAYSLDPAGLVNDGAWDSDADSLSNYEEIFGLGTDPARPDTDDDGVPDGEEVRQRTDPLHPMSSQIYRPRVLNLGATPANGIVLPDPARFLVRTNGWTIECWLRPADDGEGDIFALEPSAASPGFRVGLSDYRPRAEIGVGTNLLVAAGGAGPFGSIQRLPSNEWSHVAWVWSPEENSLRILVNGVLLVAQETLAAPDFFSGTGIFARGWSSGHLDEFRFWNYARSWEEVDYWHRRLVPAPSGYVRVPASSPQIAAYYRFDDGASNIVDFARLNDPNYFLPNAATMTLTNTPPALLGGDDEDGDLLPEWWVRTHGLEHYPSLTIGPQWHYFDDKAKYVARVSYYRAFRAFASIGNQTAWAQPPDYQYYAPRDSGLGHDGRYSSYMRYVYLRHPPTSALLQLFTPGMESTIAFVNGQQVTPTGAYANTRQDLDVAPYLKQGRNLIYVRCVSQYDTWADPERTQPLHNPDTPHYERAIGKFDARLIVDGVEHIVRGDATRNDPRAVWFVQTWSTFWQLMNGDMDQSRPDREGRALPGNTDYGLPFDADGDGLNALFEYLVGTNPRDADSNNNGVPDGLEDADGDFLANREEQQWNTHPLLPDTDDDALTDAAELAQGADPANAQSPAVSRALHFDGAPESYVEFPLQRRFALSDWTLEAWVRLNSQETNGATLVARRVGPNGVNYELGLGDGVKAPLNVPFVSYTSVDGSSVTAAGSVALTPGTNWTHVAGSYDSATRALVLYVNGEKAAQAASALVAPAVYAGGPVVQRIGPGLSGALDEIRIWSVACDPLDLRARYRKTLSGAEPNLVAYYRADDGTHYRAAPLVGTSANNGTNGAVNVPVWTWGQVQDYARKYSADWWEHWIHAATLRGAANFIADGALPIPPSLRVTLLPPEAVAAGAQWALLGFGSWRDSGVTVYEGLEEGEHTLVFKSIAGWTAPSNQLVRLTNGVLTALTATYLRNGAIRVDLGFVDAETHGRLWPTDGARWRILGGPWQLSGQTLTNLPPGSYLVEFMAIPGWSTPDPMELNLQPGQTLLALAQYTPQTGPLQVFIEPAEVIALGARWRLDAGPWQPSGQLLDAVRVGEHTVTFSNVPPWITPPPRSVAITTNLLVITGVYRQVTGIYLEIEPPEAVAAGARWRVNQGGWTNSGALVRLLAGSYRIDFLPLPGWGPAPVIHTAVTNDRTTFLTAYYWPMEIYGPPGETNAVVTLYLNEPRGLALGPDRALYIADSRNHRIVVLDTRFNTVTSLGAFGTSPGQFNQPFGVALDRATNLYVADTGNHRVQRRSPNGAWTVWGGPYIGTNVGQFNQPFDVAVDAFTNLYVADRSNYRVQRRAPTGVWSVHVTNGAADAFVRLAKAVAVDASNRLAVCDYDPATAWSRIQLFGTNGAFLGRIGSSTNTEGGLARAQRMAWGMSNDLYVADMNNNRVVRRRDPGVWQTLLDETVLARPEGVAWDPRGYLYIADTANHRILRIQVWRSPNIPPTFTWTAPGPSGVTIQWMGAAGWFYAVQYSDDLDVWQNLPDAEQLPGVEGPMTATDSTNVNLPLRVYRVIAY